MAWIPIGIATALSVSLLAGLVIAATLGRIAARMSELDHELWASLPLSNEA